MKTLKQHHWSASSKEQEKIAQQLTKKVMSGATFSEALGLPDEKLKDFYEFSQELFAAGRYEDACAVLFVISLLSPNRPAVWVSLGLARENLEELEQALAAYEHAIQLAPGYIESYYFAARCALNRGGKDAAIAYLQQMEEKGMPSDDDAPILELAKRLKEEITHG